MSLKPLQMDRNMHGIQNQISIVQVPLIRVFKNQDKRQEESWRKKRENTRNKLISKKQNKMDLKGDRKSLLQWRGMTAMVPPGPTGTWGQVSVLSYSTLLLLLHSPRQLQPTPPSITSVLPTENVDSRLPVPRSLVNTSSFSRHRQARQINI